MRQKYKEEIAELNFLQLLALILLLLVPILISLGVGIAFSSLGVVLVLLGISSFFVATIIAALGSS